jgi:PKD repeat protein
MKQLLITLIYLCMFNSYINSASVETILSPTLPTLPTSGSKFGYDVAVSGDYAFASSDMITSYVGGKVRVFKKTNNVWAQSQELYLNNTCGNRNKDACQYFGYEIDAENEWLAVGAPLWDSDCLSNIGPDGSVFIYKRVADTYVLQQQLFDPNFLSAQRFGESVSISGEWLFIGSTNKTFTISGTTYSSAGMVFIYRYNVATDRWEAFQTITASDKVVSGMFGPYLEYGTEVEVCGTKAMVSDPNKNVNGTNYKGTVYFLTFDGTSWSETQKLTMGAEFYLGYSITMSGDYAAIGTSGRGSVYIYQYANNTWNAVQTITKTGSGSQIAMSGKYLAIDDPQFITNYMYTGAANIYKLTNGAWGLFESVYPSDGQQLSYNNFGNDIDLSGGKLVVGASLHYNNLGKVYMYEGFANEPSLIADFTPSALLKPVPSTIAFTDASTAQFTNITSWAWDFDGDGVNDQVNANNNPVSHAYNTSGVYPVRLTVSNGTISSSKIQLISILEANLLRAADTCLSYIPVKGLSSENYGIAAWNTTAGAPEAEKWGHVLPQPPASIGWAYYYMASSEYSGIDALSKGGMHATQGIENWPNLKQALTDNSFNPEDISINFDLLSLNGDHQNNNWSIVGDRETRKYDVTQKYSQFQIKLKGEKMINGDMSSFTMYIDYKAYLGGVDKISGKTEFARPYNDSESSSVAVKNVAAAFMQDCGRSYLSFMFSSIQPANQMEFIANGRTGGFFEVQQGFIMKSCPCTAITLNAGDTLWTKPNVAHQLSLDVVGGNPPYAFRWSPALGLSNETVQNPEVNLAASQTYTVTVEDQNGCLVQTSKQVEVVNFADIHGNVRDADYNSFLIPEVKINLEGGHIDSVITSKDGAYSFSNLFPGRIYRIKAVRHGYLNYQTNNFDLNPGETKEFNFLMSPDANTGIASMNKNQDYTLSVTDNTIIVKNVDENSDVILYDITGRALNIQTAKNKNISFDINKKGIYLIQFQRNKQKVLIKTVF